MSFTVSRFIDTGKQTVGQLFFENQFLCFTLEDTFREEKVYGETRIAEGCYDLKLREYGGHHEKYKTRFAGMHKGMVQVMGVPNFTDILIHCGNNEEHTHGCLLVGNDVLEANGKYTIGDSSGAYKKVYPKLAEKLGKITYYDRERYDLCEINAELLNVRKSPGGEIKGKLALGSEVKKYFEMDGWAFTDYGYVGSRFLTEV